MIPVSLISKSVAFTALPPLSLYIHVPWCVKKCPYCDFNSHEARGGFSEKEYVDALIRDLEMALPQIWGRKVYTVFFGGGTPSLLSGEAITEILRQVRMLLPLSGDAEITLEANPGTVEAAKFAAFRDAGVNRLSMGIQSFNDTHLQALGRIHTADEAKAAIDIAQLHFDNINLDLMYALPKQTLDQALQDVQTALTFKPQHLSAYHLTLEPNTLFYRNPPSLPDDDASADMQQAIEALLAENGYQHYETSAFAQPNRRSRHNLNYWKFGDYLGIGAGAHSKLSFPDKIVREARYKQPQAYMQQVALGAPVQTEHEVSRDEIPFEFMMNALRLNEGFDAALFCERTSLSLISIQRELLDAEKRGLLSRDIQRIAPTLQGQRFLNDLLEIFLADKD
ncbi:radical SAM family heme chaperone HemW [Gallionella capsiferriformans]|jgi:oxygen-independent coproporphyrinogen-3 oxidase|uniref:Heme chaperone HemW n=1 Tax=Gallionella capsiferriformans (strain ES-2) TaxID=395494 RepID=D9SJU0_GALCS|nr:radical SAM family heme chaperone HemW [Gallionella capsiferriformans]ADL54439.1 oxygen-independent coproporphyrinogen III oxidase [Gallionella capsiferriformans ES-2]